MESVAIETVATAPTEHAKAVPNWKERFFSFAATSCGICTILSLIAVLAALITGYAVLERGCDPFSSCSPDHPDAENQGEGHYECTDEEGAHPYISWVAVRCTSDPS